MSRRRRPSSLKGVLPEVLLQIFDQVKYTLNLDQILRKSIPLLKIFVKLTFFFYYLFVFALVNMVSHTGVKMQNATPLPVSIRVQPKFAINILIIG